jgi:hypothetical protein
MNRFLKDTLAAHDTEPALDGALQPRVQRLLQQTSMKLAQNELREWGKILLSHRPAVQAGIQSGIQSGIARNLNKRAVKKTALAAVALGVGYYLLTRR